MPFADVNFGVYGGNAALTIISLVFGLAVLGANVYMAIDANKYQDAQFQQAGTSKGLWIGLGIGGAILGLCCCAIIGIPGPIVWFASYKKKVEGAGGLGFGGPAGGPPGGPTGGFGGPPPPGGGFGGPPPGGGFPPPPPPPG